MAIIPRPEVPTLNEPPLGLAPLWLDEVLATVRRLKEEGMTIILVELNVREALELADRGYVMQTGRIVEEGKDKELMASDRFAKLFWVSNTECFYFPFNKGKGSRSIDYSLTFTYHALLNHSHTQVSAI